MLLQLLLRYVYSSPAGPCCQTPFGGGNASGRCSVEQCHEAQRPPGDTPPFPQYAVTTLAHAPPSPPTRPTRPRPPRPAPASPLLNCSRHAAASAQARCQLTGRFALGFRPNPLGGTFLITRASQQRHGALASAARPQQQRTELHQVRAKDRRRGETTTCAVCYPLPGWRRARPRRTSRFLLDADRNRSA